MLRSLKTITALGLPDDTEALLLHKTKSVGMVSAARSSDRLTEAVLQSVCEARG